MRKRWALSVPFEDFTLAELGALARDAEAMGYSDAWSGETEGTDCFTPLTAVAAATGMRVGTGIVNVYTRGPQVLAATAAGMAELAPGRFVLGVGAGSANIIERWNGLRFVRPVSRVREMVQVLRAALAGERVVFHGETLDVDGYRLARPPKEPVPIHVAALRPGMLKVAGTLGDGVALNWLAAEDVRKSVDVARAAAADAGRDPDALEVTARLFVSLDPDDEQRDMVLRRWVTGYLNVPTYRAFQRWLGRGDELGPMFEAWDAGDRKTALARVPQRTIRDLFITGSPAERRAHLRRYFDAGIDTAFLHFMTNETDRARRREIVLRGIEEMSPAAG